MQLHLCDDDSSYNHQFSQLGNVFVMEATTGTASIDPIKPPYEHAGASKQCEIIKSIHASGGHETYEKRRRVTPRAFNYFIYNFRCLCAIKCLMKQWGNALMIKVPSFLIQSHTNTYTEQRVSMMFQAFLFHINLKWQCARICHLHRHFPRG